MESIKNSKNIESSKDTLQQETKKYLDNLLRDLLKEQNILAQSPEQTNENISDLLDLLVWKIKHNVELTFAVKKEFTLLIEKIATWAEKTKNKSIENPSWNNEIEKQLSWLLNNVVATLYNAWRSYYQKLLEEHAAVNKHAAAEYVQGPLLNQTTKFLWPVLWSFVQYLRNKDANTN